MGCMGIQWCSAGAEGNDAAYRVVRRNADRHAITWNDLDPEAAHPAAQLCEHLVALVALHAVKPAAVDCDNGALYID